MGRARRYWWAAAAVVALLIPVALLAPGAARAAGNPVSPYGGLTPSQRASLLAIARDTWKFYGADVDQATSLPMDNITFAGGCGHAHRLRPVHLGRQHRGLPVGGGGGPGPRPDQPSRRPAPGSRPP